MDPTALPPQEPRWTCRVWVKEALQVLDENGHIDLPCSIGRSHHGYQVWTLGTDDDGILCVDRLEQAADAQAHNCFPDYMGNAKVINDTEWMTEYQPVICRRATAYNFPSWGFDVSSQDPLGLGWDPYYDGNSCC
jgi:hypothetical protein